MPAGTVGNWVQYTGQSPAEQAIRKARHQAKNGCKPEAARTPVHVMLGPYTLTCTLVDVSGYRGSPCRAADMQLAVGCATLSMPGALSLLVAHVQGRAVIVPGQTSGALL